MKDYNYDTPLLAKGCLFLFGFMFFIEYIIICYILDWLDLLREEWKATKNVQ